MNKNKQSILQRLFPDLNGHGMANAVCGYLTEVLFTALPFVVLMLIYTHKGEQERILKAPELSFAAAVLFGQSIIKMLGPAASRGGFYGDRVAFTGALIIVFCLVPSLVVLSLILLSGEPSDFLIRAQISLAAFSLFSLWLASCVARIDEIKNRKKKEANKAVETTPVAVTTGADAPVAPSTSVSHLGR